MKRFSVLFLSLILICCAFAGCSENTSDENAPENIRISVLNGTTGFGMAKLMDDNAENKTKLHYSFGVETDASNITAQLINGDVDIAALATNAAANLYNKSNGKIKVIAVNTLGVLYLVTGKGENITEFADLEGKTVYTPAQNPAFIFEALCKKNNVNVTIDTSFSQPAELRTAVASGTVGLAVLPEPMVTIAQSANPDISVALDLTAEWNKVFPENSLIQGCVVVRSRFAEEYPQVVSDFLDEYKESIGFLKNDPKECSELIAKHGIFAQAGVAEKAIPKCNVCFIEGDQLKTVFDGFCKIMYDISPNSIGGAIPDEDFVYKR